MEIEKKSKKEIITELLELRERYERLKSTTPQPELEEKSSDVNNEEKYSLFLENYRGIAYKSKINYSPTIFIGAVKELTGYTVEEFISGKIRWDQIIYLDDLTKMDTFKQVQTIPNFSTTREYRIVHKNGMIKWVSDSIQNIVDDLGKIIEVQGVINDITETKTTETILRETEAKFEQLIQIMTDGFVILDENGLITYMNPKAHEMFELAEDQLIGQDITKILYNNIRLVYEKQIEDRNKGENKPYEVNWIDGNGVKKYAIVSPTAIFDSEGKFKGSFGIFTDITEKKEVQEKLRESELIFQEILGNITEGYYEVDLGGNFVFYNDFLAQYLGIDKEKLKGMNYSNFFEAQDSRDIFEQFSQVFQEKKISGVYQSKLKRSDKIDRFIEGTIYLKKNTSGKKTGFYGFVRDVTEREISKINLQESEENFRQLSDQSLMGIGILQESKFVYVNETSVDIFGYSIEEQLTWSALEFIKVIYPEDLPDLMKEVQIAALQNQGYQFNKILRIITKQGDIKWIDFYSKNILFMEKKANLMALIDITQRKTAEDRLRESEEKFRQISDQSHMAILIFQDDLIIYANKAAEEMIEHPIEEILSWKSSEFLKLVHPDDLKYVIRRVREKLSGEEVSPTTYRVRAILKSGIMKWLSTYSKTILYNGRPAMFTSLVDISDSVIAEERLSTRFKIEKGIAEFSRILLENKPNALNTALDILLDASQTSHIYIFENIEDPEKGLFIQMINESCAEGIKPLLNDPNIEKFTKTRLFRRWQNLLKLGKPVYGKVNDLPDNERKYFRPEGFGPLSILSLPIMVDGKWYGIVGFEDMKEARDWNREDVELLGTGAEIIGLYIERKRAETLLIQSEQKFRDVLEKSRDIFYNFNIQTQKLEYISPSITDLTGLVVGESLDISAKEWRDMAHPDDIGHLYQQRVELIGSHKSSDNIDFRIRLPDGSYHWFSDYYVLVRDKDGKPRNFIGTVRDITEIKRFEGERLRAQKIESISLLAGGIAHDFNNILVGILGNVNIMQLENSLDGNLRELLEEVEKATYLARDLTKQLLTFSKGGAPIIKPENIRSIVKDSVNFALRGSKCKHKIIADKELPAVDVDDSQINQVLNNLLINSVQAMPDGGLIRISINSSTISDESIYPLKKGEYIKISIKDEGIGIPQNIQNRIFEPYFTTKSSGNGLGLATSYSIIKQHKGYITFYSQEGNGSTFYVYLPTTSKIVESPSKPKEYFGKFKGKLLLLDDDPTIQRTLSLILGKLGFKVEIARDGNEAISKYVKAMKSNQKFALVIMDLTIPGGMGGKEAIEKIIKIDPDIKAIVSSGYSNDPIMANYKKYGFSGVLSKPYTVNQLKELLQKLL